MVDRGWLEDGGKRNETRRLQDTKKRRQGGEGEDVPRDWLMFPATDY
jgi:hypothetical protein